MLKIGITGNIGSGKTTISKLFELLGVPVFYSDDHAKQVMTNDTELIAGIKQHFGTEAYFADGTLNRKYISGIVFNNVQELQRLNSLVHPAVFRAFDAWALPHSHLPYIIKELISAPTPMRIARVMQRDGITQAEAQARNAKQMPQEEKERLSSFVIHNDNSQLVIPQALALHRQFLTLPPVYSS
jgi:dephospho-CoA kinase